MKIFVSLFLGLFLFTFAGGDAQAQEKAMTIILLRHAEKDLSTGADDPDPRLSAEGRQRAERLVQTLRKYKPQAIYSSNFQRTRATVRPLSESIYPGYRIQTQLYNHRQLNELVERMLASGADTIVVAGHNTTTPALANLLIKENKYKPLDESEYDKIFVIKVKKGKGKDELIVY
jgi:phosphohistidine phosphatase SixA